MGIGKPLARVDAVDKVTGQARFTADLCPANALVARIVHSTVANGLVKRIDTEEAAKVPGVVRIVTCFDVPDRPFPTAGHPWSVEASHQDIADRYLLAKRVLCYGDDIAVVVARDMRDDGSAPVLDLYGFFKAVQHRFYADNADPSEADFYRLPCEQFGLDFADFAQRFASPQAVQATRNDFTLARQWGVSAFPTVLMRSGDQLYLLAQGYDSADTMGQRMEAVLAQG